MNNIAIIKDSDIGYKSSIELNNPKIRYASRGIVIKDNKIAILNKTNKNEFKLPGGGIEENETPEDAFKREVLEETGCEIEIIKCLGIIEEHKTLANFKQISYVFVANVTNDTNQCHFTEKESDEGAKTLWATPNEGLKLISNCFDKIIGSKYEDEYQTKFIVYRDKTILEYYLKEINMSSEYFDVLDENGNKTGKIKLRDEVHRDGDWHKSVHIWIINQNNEILLQRRCATKDSYPNMLDISCAGHLTAGDDSITGALRELKEELNLDINSNELEFIDTIKNSFKYSDSFINNGFADMYILKTNKTIDNMKFQESEISEILFMPYLQFKKLVENKSNDLVSHPEEFEILFNIIEKRNDNL